MLEIHMILVYWTDSYRNLSVARVTGIWRIRFGYCNFKSRTPPPPFHCITDRSHWTLVYMSYTYEWGVCVFERDVMGP